jgi:MFS family permease
VRRYLTASFFWNAGTGLQVAALGKHVYDITGSELSIGLIGLAEFAPAVLFVLVSGTVADRISRKRIAMVGLAADAACSLALMWFALGDPTGAGPAYLIALMFGTARAFATPALRAIPAMIAPSGGLPRLVAMSSSVWQAAAIVGPAVSGFLYVIDPAAAYLAASVLLAAGVAGLARVPVPSFIDVTDRRPRVTVSETLEGLAFIRRTPILFAAISLDLFAVLFGGAVALLPVIAEENLGVGAVGYGWLRAGVGIGSGVMAVLLALRPVRRRVGRVLLWVVALFGGSTVVLGLTDVYVVALVAVVTASAADMVSMFIRGSIGPLVTPESKRGRVLAVESVFIGASNELGAFESGAVATLVGTSATVVGGGVATVAVAATWWFAFPALREVDTFDELEMTQTETLPGP